MGKNTGSRKIELRPKTRWRLVDVAKKMGKSVDELLEYGEAGDLRLRYSGELGRFVEHIDNPNDPDERYYWGSKWESKIDWAISEQDIRAMRTSGTADVRESMAGNQLRRIEKYEEPLRLTPHDLFVRRDDFANFLESFGRPKASHGNRSHGETRERNIIEAAKCALEKYPEKCLGKNGRATLTALSEFLFHEWNLVSKMQQPKGIGGQPLSPETMRRNQLKKGKKSGEIPLA